MSEKKGYVESVIWLLLTLLLPVALFIWVNISTQGAGLEGIGVVIGAILLYALFTLVSFIFNVYRSFTGKFNLVRLFTLILNIVIIIFVIITMFINGGTAQ